MRYVALLLLPALPALAQPVYDNSAALGTSSSGTISASYTVGSGTNRLLLVSMAWSTVPNWTPSVTWGSQSLTLIGGAGSCMPGNGCVASFGLVAPASGTNTISIGTASGSPPSTYYAAAISYSGANQTGMPMYADSIPVAPSGINPIVANITTTVANSQLVAILGPGGNWGQTGCGESGTLRAADNSIYAFGTEGPISSAGATSISFCTQYMGGQGVPAQVLAVAPPGSNCTITNSSPLTSGITGVPYSLTLSTSGCLGPTFSGTGLPAGLSLNASSGVISGAPTGTCSPCSASVSISDANPTPGSPYSFALTITLPATPAFTAGPTFTANSPSSILFSGTANVAVSVQVTCGTVAGPTVYGWSNGAWWGQSTFTYALTGLANNASGTPYSCAATIANAAGVTASGTGSANTTAALASTALAVTRVSPPTRTNDQFNGSNGMPDTGQYDDGDTRYGTWDDLGHLEIMSQDAAGCKNGGAGINVEQWDTKLSTCTQLASLAAGLGLNAAPFSEQGAISVRGSQYIFTMDGYGSAACCFNVLKTSDHWAHSTNSQDNVGPISPGYAGLHAPPIQSATIRGHGFASGTLTLTVSTWGVTPPAVTYIYISGSTNCDGLHVTTGASATTVSYASSTDEVYTAGTVQYMQALLQNVAANGASGIYWLLSPVQACQDYSMNCVAYAGMDGWLYLFAHYRGLFRIRIEDLPLQNVSKFECYTGTQNADDGLYDANWGPATGASCAALTAAGGAFDPYAYMNSLANKGQIVFVPDANRFVLTMYVGPNGCATSSWIFDLGPYPWGKPVFIGQINRDYRFPGMCPSFGSAVTATYQKVSASPYIAEMNWLTSGGIFPGSNPASDNYSMYTWQVTLAEATPTQPSRPCMTYPGGPGCIPLANLDVFYPGVQGPNPTVIPNWSPNDPAQNYAVAPGGPVVYDHTGLAMTYPNSGGNSTDGITWGGAVGRAAVAYTTPYTKSLGSFGTMVCFYRPYQLGATIWNPGAASETVVADPNFTIVRHGTTYGPGASWDVSVHGTVVGQVAIADGSPGCIAITNSGTTASIYASTALEGLPLTPTATATVSAGGTSGALVLGSSSNPYYGDLLAVLVWSETPTQSQLVSAMSGMRKWIGSGLGLTLP